MIPRFRLAPALGACALVILGATPAVAQVQTVTLGRPDATLSQSMSAVTGVRELSNGRLLVTDPTEQTVSLVDFSSGTVTTLGHRGEGPGEFQMPGDLFALPGDTTLMVDRALQRISTILPTGQISANTRPLRGPNGLPLMLRGVDAKGRYYFDLAGIMMPGLEQTAASGTAPLYRWTPGSGVPDSLGVVHFPPMPVSGGGPGEVRVSIGGGGPYRGRDDWAVAPDGRIAVARYQEFHLDWIGPNGGTVSGPAITYTPVPITHAEKEAWADQVSRTGLMIQVENGQRRTMRPPRPDIDRQNWPDVMPPFLNGAVWVTPEGEAWVVLAGPAKAAHQTLDVFDSQGRLTRVVRLPEDRRLVGFGKGVLYAVRVDADDLQWLERYRR